MAADIGRKPFPLSSPHSDTVCGLHGLGEKIKGKDFGKRMPCKISVKVTSLQSLTKFLRII